MIKAYAATKAGAELTPYEYDPGPLGLSQVEIDVEHCGICHSDISMIDNEWGMSAYPLIAGHEIVGKIAQVGPQVTHLKLGDTVGLGWHAGFCEHCHHCRSGDHNLCSTASQTIVQRHGGFADKVRAEANSAVLLPSGLDSAKAGPLFCGGITVFNPLVQFNVKPTDKVAVIGIGGLGHLALQFYRAWGCEVTAFSSNPEKAQEATQLGAHRILNSKDTKAMESHSRYFDFIISTVNVKLNWNAYLSTLAPKGRLHYVGATLEPLDLGVFNLISAQRSVSGTPVGSPENIASMLTFAERHNIYPQTEHFNFKDINQAIMHLKQGKARYRVVLDR
jgi:uncharacterized zinc-type alcohol dehydrogenase-like protein